MSGIAISLPAFWKTFDSYAKPPSLLLTTTRQFTLLSQNDKQNNFTVRNRAERGGNFIQAAKTNQLTGFPNARAKSVKGRLAGSSALQLLVYCALPLTE
jgi:hypothetical protein